MLWYSINSQFCKWNHWEWWEAQREWDCWQQSWDRWGSTWHNLDSLSDQWLLYSGSWVQNHRSLLMYFVLKRLFHFHKLCHYCYKSEIISCFKPKTEAWQLFLLHSFSYHCVCCPGCSQLHEFRNIVKQRKQRYWENVAFPHWHFVTELKVNYDLISWLTASSQVTK